MYRYDEKAAEAAVGFIETYVRHVKGEWEGQLIKLEDWQKDEIIRPLFGWKDQDGLRKYRRVYIELPRKNAKSFLAACVIILILFVDDEPGMEIYGAAASKDQARIVFEVVRQIIQKDPILRSQCNILKNSIMVGEKFYQAVSKDSHTQHGYNAHVAVVDELHAHKDGDLLEVLETSMGSRRQPLTFIITTAGDSLTSVCRDNHNHAKKVLRGLIKDERLLPVIYAADENDDPFDEEVWKKANPMYGISVKPDYIKAQADRAKQSAGFLNVFKRLHLNIWTNTRDAWILDHVWDASGMKLPKRKNREQSQEEIDFLDSLRGATCYGGLDLALSSDISALTLLFPLEDENFVSLNWFWLPEEQSDYSVNTSNRDYPEWVYDGYIVETYGNVTDFKFIIAKIIELSSIYNLVGVGYDPAHASAMAVELTESGVELFKHRSGFVSANEPFEMMTRLVTAKKFNHLNNPVLAWMASNVRVVHDSNGNSKPDRKLRTEKIDGILSNMYALMSYQFVNANGTGATYLTNSEGEIFSF